jgi:hypothetical protein
VGRRRRPPRHRRYTLSNSPREVLQDLVVFFVIITTKPPPANARLQVLDILLRVGPRVFTLTYIPRILILLVFIVIVISATIIKYDFIGRDATRAFGVSKTSVLMRVRISPSLLRLHEDKYISDD